MRIALRRGLDIAISGAPRQVLGDRKEARSVALLGADYPDVRPALRVDVGDRVAAGQTLFVDRRRPDIAFAAPAGGTVAAIHRGRRRALDALVIERDGEATEAPAPDTGPADAGIRNRLLKAGLWPAFRVRPLGGIPDPDATPDAIFVTAMDTNPLAADAAVVIASDAAAFRAGVEALDGLSEGPILVCHAPGPAPVEEGKGRARCIAFAGPHPAGLPGTHIHFLAPTGGGRVVWHVDYQDVMAIGRLLTTGKFAMERVVALAGPGVRDPRLVATTMGARLDDLTAGELRAGRFRIVSGSALSGRESGFLGRYHSQVSVLPAPREAWRPPLLSRLLGARREAPRPLVPTAAFERVLPLDILPVPLLRALSVGDTETAERLGCLELVEEDMALLSYVCASGTDYGALLRATLEDLKEAR